MKLLIFHSYVNVYQRVAGVAGWFSPQSSGNFIGNLTHPHIGICFNGWSENGCTSTLSFEFLLKWFSSTLFFPNKPKLHPPYHHGAFKKTPGRQSPVLINGAGYRGTNGMTQPHSFDGRIPAFQTRLDHSNPLTKITGHMTINRAGSAALLN